MDMSSRLYNIRFVSPHKFSDFCLFLDSYVAVAGLPQPRKDHALIMARFADDCLEKMGQIARELESHFG